jgi:hypothetical protein
MSKIFENKQQIIHIAIEVIAVIAISFYFSQKNKKLMNQIEDLSHRIEEQEEIIEKHDKIIKKMMSSIQMHETTIENLKSLRNTSPKKVSKNSSTNVNMQKNINNQVSNNISNDIQNTKPRITIVKKEIILSPIIEEENEPSTRVEEIIEDETFEDETVKDLENVVEDTEENLDKELELELGDLEK